MLGAASRLLKESAPAAWHWITYRRYLIGPHAEREIRLLHHFVDRNLHAIDVGVHLGMYTRHLATLSAGVIGFEANPSYAELAKRTVGHFARIETVALSSRTGTASLRVPLALTEEGLATIHGANHLDGSHRVIEVRTKRLDDYLLPQIGFIKIDVEGHEEEVLSGASKTIERDKPVLLIEIENRHNPGGLFRISEQLRKLSYNGFFYDGNVFNRISRFSIDKFQLAESHPYIYNFFFLPPGRKSIVDDF